MTNSMTTNTNAVPMINQRKSVNPAELDNLVQVALDVLFKNWENGVEFTAYMVTLGLRSMYPDLEILHTQNGRTDSFPDDMFVRHVVHEKMAVQRLNAERPYRIENRDYIEAGDTGNVVSAKTYIPDFANALTAGTTVVAKPVPANVSKVDDVQVVTTAPATMLLSSVVVSADGVKWDD